VKRVEEMDVCELWAWLQEHPAYVLPSGGCPNFWQALPMALDVDFVHVDPITRTVEDDPARNTHVKCWLEMGSLFFEEICGTDEDGEMRLATEPSCYHDIELDSGGDTFEEAFRTLCLKVLEQDGDYERGE
jgi:hypothetical protein